MTGPQAPPLRAGDVLMTRTAPCGVRFERTATPNASVAFTAFARIRAL
ncbi:hypothetical protein ACFVVP_02775 [Streptomyces sp. NPDC058128]|nr:hypothetical protein [Streptomyces sp. CB02009]